MSALAILKLIASVALYDIVLAAGALPLETYSLRVALDPSSGAALIVLLLFANVVLLTVTLLAFRANFALLNALRVQVVAQASKLRNR